MESFWPVVVIVSFYLIFTFIQFIHERISVVSNRKGEDKKYLEILREITPKLKDIDLDLYQKFLLESEDTYRDIYDRSKVTLKNKEGDVINICPRCGGYMKIVRWREKIFLGCSNYPNCKFTRNYSKIFNIKV